MNAGSRLIQRPAFTLPFDLFATLVDGVFERRLITVVPFRISLEIFYVLIVVVTHVVGCYTGRFQPFAEPMDNTAARTT